MKDLVRIHFEGEIPPRERVTLRPRRAERLRTRSVSHGESSGFTFYRPPVEVEVSSIKLFVPQRFIFGIDLAETLEMSVAYAKLRLASLTTNDEEHFTGSLPIGSFAWSNVVPLACAPAEISLAILNTGEETVPFRMVWEGAIEQEKRT